MQEFLSLAHPTADSRHPVLVLTTLNGSRYFFGGMPEGTQRIIAHNGIKLGNVRGVFLTGGLNWPKIGGLPGFILSTSDRGTKSLGISYGNGIMKHFLALWRYFVFRKGIDLKCHTIDFDQNVYKDANVTVRAFEVGSNYQNSEAVQSYISKLDQIITKMFPLDEPANKPNTKKEASQKALEESSASDPNLSDPYVNTAISAPKEIENIRLHSTNYLIEFEPSRGKFDVSKAQKLNVPKGRLYAQLTKGELIALEDGLVVKPEDVMGPDRPFGLVLVLDMASDDMVGKTLDAVQQLQKQHQDKMEKVKIVYTFFDSNVDLKLESVGSLFALFPHSKIIISHPDYVPNSINFNSAASFLLALSSINNEHYKLPRFSVQSKKSLDQIAQLHNADLIPMVQNQREKLGYDYSITSEMPEKLPSLVEAYWKNANNEYEDRLTKFHTPLVPKKRKREMEPVDFFLHKAATLADSLVPSKEKMNTFLSNLDKLTIESLRLQSIVVTLGTGLALPLIFRNVSLTLVKTPFVKPGKKLDLRAVLLDAGENTLGSLKRLLLEKEYASFFGEELQMLYISHLHADHHLGAASVISEWARFRKPWQKLYIVGPWQFSRFLSDIRSVDSGLHHLKGELVFISCEEFLENTPQQDHKDKVKKMLSELNLNKVRTVRAHHCPWSYCVTLDFALVHLELEAQETGARNSLSVSYSGDTRPIKAFADIGYGCDVLVHEATLEDEMQAMAIAKCHSTIGEAIALGREMQCKKLILSHFSQRYPKMLPLEVTEELELREAQSIETDQEKMPILYSYDGLIWKIGRKERSQGQIMKDMLLVFDNDGIVQDNL